MVGAVTDLADIVRNRTDADIVKQARKDAGLTQVEAALVFGVSERQWSRYENGASVFPRKKWRDLINFTQVWRDNALPADRQCSDDEYARRWERTFTPQKHRERTDTTNDSDLTPAEN